MPLNWNDKIALIKTFLYPAMTPGEVESIPPSTWWLDSGTGHFGHSSETEHLHTEFWKSVIPVMFPNGGQEGIILASLHPELRGHGNLYLYVRRAGEMTHLHTASRSVHWIWRPPFLRRPGVWSGSPKWPCSRCCSRIWRSTGRPRSNWE